MFGHNVTSLQSYKSRVRDWSPQDLAEFYRVESALIQAGILVYTDSGVTDEGDPWFIFCRESDNEIVVHIAHIDGHYIIASSAYMGVARGKDLRGMVRDLLERHKLSTAGADKNSNIFMHPSALLILVIGAAFFKTTDKAEAGESSSSKEVAQVTKKSLVLTNNDNKSATATLSSLLGEVGLAQLVEQQNISQQTIQIAAAISLAAADAAAADTSADKKLTTNIQSNLVNSPDHADPSHQANIIVTNEQQAIDPLLNAEVARNLSEILPAAHEIMPALIALPNSTSALSLNQRILDFSHQQIMADVSEANINQIIALNSHNSIWSASINVPVILPADGVQGEDLEHKVTDLLSSKTIKTAATKDVVAVASISDMKAHGLQELSSQPNIFTINLHSGAAAQLLLNSIGNIDSGKLTFVTDNLPNTLLSQLPETSLILNHTKDLSSLHEVTLPTAKAPAVVPNASDAVLSSPLSATSSVSGAVSTTSTYTPSKNMLFMTDAVSHEALSISETSFIQTLSNFISQAPSVKVYDTTNHGVVFFDQAAFSQQNSNMNTISVLFSDGSSISIVGQAEVLHQLVAHS